MNIIFWIIGFIIFCLLFATIGIWFPILILVIKTGLSNFFYIITYPFRWFVNFKYEKQIIGTMIAILITACGGILIWASYAAYLKQVTWQETVGVILFLIGTWAIYINKK